MTLGVACYLKHVFSDCFNAEKADYTRRGPKSKQIGSSDYCRISWYCLYVDSTGQSSRFRKARKNLFIESVRQSVVRLAVIRLEALGLDFPLLKP